MNRLTQFKAVAALFAAVLITGNVAAATTIMEEIVVTATKRSENVQDVGIAITAMTGDQMEALGFTSAQQVTTMAPGVSTVQPNGEANYSIAMRGVANSDFTTNVESPVAVYVDEVYISQMSGTGFMLFDMERVELLRGPQGTLFGRNATGGLVHFLTVKPSQESNGYAKVTVGEYSQIKAEGAVGGALGDNASARLSLSYHNNDGYVKNRLGDALGVASKLNNADDFAGRFQLLFNPNDNVEVLLNARYATQDIDTGFFEYVSSVLPGQLTPGVPNPIPIPGIEGYFDNDGDIYEGDYNDPGFNDLTTYGFTGTVSWGIGEMNLTSITDFSSVERRYIEDSDASPADFFNFFLTTNAEQFSQEFRLDGTAGEVQWVAGVYYLDIDINDSNGAITDPFIGPAPTAGAEAGLNNPYSSRLKSISAFGQIELPLSDDVDLILGARIINDDKKFDFETAAVEFFNPDERKFNGDSNLGLLGVIASYKGDRSDTEFSTRVQLNWRATDDALLYASYNRGVKGGGFNAPIFPLAVAYDDDSMSFDPEVLDALEVGFKTTVMDGRARFNGAVYYYNYSDYQAFNIVGIDTLTFNADAKSKGFELEFQANPVDNLDVVLGLAFNDIDVDLGPGPDTTSVQSPKWSWNALMRYQWPMSSGGSLAIQGDANYRSKHVFALTALPNQTENGYTLANASLTYTTASEAWSVSAYIKNITGSEYLVQTFDLSTDALFALTEQYYGPPRWWGVSFRYTWAD